MTSLIRSNLLPTNIFEDFFRGADDIFGGYKTSIPYNVAHVIKDDEVIATKLEVALAGYDKEDIQVKVTNTELQILVDKAEKEDEDIRYIHKGIAGRSAQLKFRLVSGYDVKKIKSAFKNGLLIVEIPVDTGNTIDIKVD